MTSHFLDQIRIDPNLPNATLVRAANVLYKVSQWNVVHYVWSYLSSRPYTMLI